MCRSEGNLKWRKNGILSLIVHRWSVCKNAVSTAKCWMEKAVYRSHIWHRWLTEEEKVWGGCVSVRELGRLHLHHWAGLTVTPPALVSCDKTSSVYLFCSQMSIKTQSDTGGCRPFHRACRDLFTGATGWSPCRYVLQSFVHWRRRQSRGCATEGWLGLAAGFSQLPKSENVVQAPYGSQTRGLYVLNISHKLTVGQLWTAWLSSCFSLSPAKESSLLHILDCFIVDRSR